MIDRILWGEGGPLRRGGWNMAGSLQKIPFAKRKELLSRYGFGMWPAWLRGSVTSLAFLVAVCFIDIRQRRCAALLRRWRSSLLFGL